MNIYPTGIVWDPREPPPPNYANYAHRNTRNNATADSQAGIPKVLPTRMVTELGQNILPPASVSIVVQITGDIAKVAVRQLFWNDADTPIKKGSYTFPIPAGCTITSFSCRLGNNKVLKAKAVPKREAREAFQEAVTAQRYAALLEQDTPEIFTASLGSIPADTRVKAEITYMAFLKLRFSANISTATLTIPTYLADRYGQRPHSLQGADLRTQPEEVLLRIEVVDFGSIRSIRSDSHEILVDRCAGSSGPLLHSEDINQDAQKSNPESVVVILKEKSHWFNTDFILSIETAILDGTKCPNALLEVHPSLENHAAMVINIPPGLIESQAAVAERGEVVFLVDRSGSMDDKMDSLKTALYSCLREIPFGRPFNIWSFGSTYHSLWPTSQECDELALRLALKHVTEHFCANLGGTELLAALKAVIRSRDIFVPCDIIVITDGEVWHLDETLDIVSQTSRLSGGNIRFFSLGVGAHVSHALINGIATRGGGYSEVIPHTNQEGWDKRVATMLKAALTIHAELKLSIGGIKAVTSPPDLGSLKLLQATRVFLLQEQDAILEDQSISDLTISIGNNIIKKIKITRLATPGTAIHKLCARAILNDLKKEPDTLVLSVTKAYIIGLRTRVIRFIFIIIL
ncbi:hypothetical protein O1611_g720 [Lasiodiplodia mahajangana]|uniref:Uncharacterized protein n=1 Tax=Lasiodiplodia mahajangana TaxID=1108764 RepID=A0ACC2JZR7_9PEZI|nr:hypothetical protein O1611_g720 [Lasiodiplodia mahajangana]